MDFCSVADVTGMDGCCPRWSRQRRPCDCRRCSSLLGMFQLPFPIERVTHEVLRVGVCIQDDVDDERHEAEQVQDVEHDVTIGGN